jgi:imidazolonepropionase-like amidohydrolase
MRVVAVLVFTLFSTLTLLQAQGQAPAQGQGAAPPAGRQGGGGAQGRGGGGGGGRGGGAPQPGPVIVYEGARLIVGDGRPALEGGQIVVQDGRILAVGTNVAPGGAQRVNLAGKTVMPLMIDTHVHLSQERAALEQDLRRRMHWGVQAALSMGQDTEQAPIDVRNNPIPGTGRFFTAGRGITRPEMGRSMAPYWINTPEEGRAAVREQAARGVDIIKIWVDDRNGMFMKLTPPLYGAIIEEAHQRGLRVAAHIFTLDDAKGLIMAGLDAFAHGVRDREIDNAFLQMWRARSENVWLIPNLPGRGVPADYTWLRGFLSDAELMKIEMGNTANAQAAEAFGIQAKNLKALADIGAKITVGTDGNTPYAVHFEMEDMVASGMTPMQVITAATRNGAEFLRMRDTGTLEAGKFADFVVLDANPLEDIKNTRRINAVYLRGTTVQR